MSEKYSQPDQRIIIDRSYLNEVAEGYESPESVQGFSRIELSVRTYLLGTLYQKVQGTPEAHDADFDLNWQSLVTLQQQDPAILHDMLSSPATGSWLTTTVQRLRIRHEGPTTLATDVGYFGNIAAGFAVRHGRTQASFVGSALNGRVHVPGIGTATFSHDTHKVTMHVHEGMLRIIGNDQSIAVDDVHTATEAWQPVWHYVSPNFPDESIPPLRVLIDDADPYHSGPNLHMLDATEYAQWRERLDEAWSILHNVHPHAARELANGLQCIVPKPARNRFEAYSSSSTASIGSIEASLPATGIEMAEILLHEYGGHSKLNKVLRASNSAVRHDTLGATLYAPWRDDPRPSGGVLHGVYSFSRVAEFYNRLRPKLVDGPQADLADFERVLWREQAAATMGRLKNIWLGHAISEGSTYKAPQSQESSSVASNIIFTDILRAVDDAQWHDSSDVSSDISRLVAMAIFDHRTLWRLYHLKPDEESVEQLLHALNSSAAVADAGVGVVSRVVADATACRLDARAIAMRHYLQDRTAFANTVEGDLLDKADRALIVGNTAVAHACYLSVLEEDPLHNRAFVGALLSNGKHLTAARPDIRMPHVMLAVQQAIMERGSQPVPLSDLYKALRYIKSHSSPPGT